MSRLHVGLTPWAAPDTAAVDTYAHFLDQVERAEQLEFHSFWLPESHFQAGASYPAPLLLLAAAAARSERLRLGTTSYLLPVRHPVHVAEEVGVLEQLSGGRVILGVGRGFRPALFEAFNVPAREKRDRFESALAQILRAWQGQPVAPSNRGCVSPLPLQKPHPPIWVAAFGPKALAQAGRLDLPYLASPLEPLDQLVENYALHRRARPEGSPAGAIPVIRTLFLTRDLSVERRVRGALEAQARAQGADRRLGRLAATPLEEWALLGHPEDVALQIERYREAIGLTHLIARVAVPGADAAELNTSVELLASLARGLR